ncbi:MAG: response regulator [Myxococcota bacterium]
MSERPKVLVVDDDRDLLDLLELVLDMRGYDVRTAANGEEGLAEAERETPDVILLDMKMPVMNGWDFAKRYRRKPDPRAPIVVFTASADARRIADEIGAEDFIGKPFDVSRLVSKVGRWAQAAKR